MPGETTSALEAAVLRRELIAKSHAILATTNDTAFRRVHCEYSEGRLVLWGLVDSDHIREAAAVALNGLVGAASIQNRIQIEARSPAAASNGLRGF